MTLSEWFDDEPEAAAAARLLAPTTSSRILLRYLQDAYGFPFRDHVAVWRMFGGERAVAPSGKRERVRQEFYRSNSDAKRLARCSEFIVTSAVSQPTEELADEHLDHTMHAACLRWADAVQAAFLVVPMRYKNPTYRGEACQDEVWPELLHDNLVENELDPHPLLRIMPTKIAATAADPLPKRLWTRTGGASAVYGHPYLAARSAPRHHLAPPRLIYTTGAITEPVGSTTLAGDIARDRHVKSVLRISVRGRYFWIREVMWDERGQRFIDQDYEFTARGFRRAPSALALALGDRHKGHDDPRVEEAIWGAGGAVDVYRPELIAWHDPFDGRKLAWQERGNRLRAAALAHETVQDEVDELREYWNGLADRAPRHVHVFDNHATRLDRWVAGTEVEPCDERYHAWLKWRVMEHQLAGRRVRAIEVALREAHEYLGSPPLAGNFEFPAVDEQVRIAGRELNSHGHLGPDGARGSPSNLIHTDVPQVSGHIHGGGIFGPDRWVGITSSGRHGYNFPPTSWVHSLCAITAAGLPQMGYIVDGRIRP